MRHFTQRFARRIGRRIESIPSLVMEALVHYPWPGNVRELENVIERAVILSPGATLQVPLGDLDRKSEVRSPKSEVVEQMSVSLNSASTAEIPPPVLGRTLVDAEREHIICVLRESNWVLGGPNGAASRLGVKRSTLHGKMKKLGISRPEYAPTRRRGRLDGAARRRPSRWPSQTSLQLLRGKPFVDKHL